MYKKNVENEENEKEKKNKTTTHKHTRFICKNVKIVKKLESIIRFFYH